MDEVQARKLQHLELALDPRVDYKDYCRSIYSEIKLIHKALPGLSFSDVSLEVEFLGYKLSAPLMITGMTGGHPSLTKVNKMLAELAESKRIAIGVGSQRAMVTSGFNSDVVASYRVVRDTARSVPVIGNIGLNTLNDIELDVVVKLVEVLDADALAIHLNPAQEVVQPEGDTRLRTELVDKVKELVSVLGKPIVIKEVGSGLSMEVVELFHRAGVRIFDVAGACGTNWALIEAYRNPPGTPRYESGLKLSEWGIPTPLSVIEARHAARDSIIIASGGVWDGFKAAVNIALGADMAGVAKPILGKLLKEGVAAAEVYLDSYIYELKTAMYLTGARTTRDLRSVPVVLGSNIVGVMLQRGIDLYKYLSHERKGH